MSRPPPVTSAVLPWRVMWCISVFLGVGGLGGDRCDASADQPETEEGDGHDRRAEREDRRIARRGEHRNEPSGDQRARDRGGAADPGEAADRAAAEIVARQRLDIADRHLETKEDAREPKPSGQGKNGRGGGGEK